MRKITRDAIIAFMNHREFKRGNTQVKIADKGTPVEAALLYLHGNQIASHSPLGLSITNAGWSSNTTKERLNGIPGVSIYQKNWEWFLNGAAWDGSWIKI